MVMKKININFLIFGLILMVSSVGCKDEEDEKSNFTFDSIEYLLKSGTIEKVDTNLLHTPNTYNYEIVLMGKGITYDETAGQYNGTGSYLVFDLVSNDPVNIQEGGYVYDGFASHDSLTITSGLMGIDHDILAGTTGMTHPVKTGIVNLRRNGNIYIINFELWTNDDKLINGFFNGFLNEIQ